MYEERITNFETDEHQRNGSNSFVVSEQIFRELFRNYIGVIRCAHSDSEVLHGAVNNRIQQYIRKRLCCSTITAQTTTAQYHGVNINSFLQDGSYVGICILQGRLICVVKHLTHVTISIQAFTLTEGSQFLSRI